MTPQDPASAQVDALLTQVDALQAQVARLNRVQQSLFDTRHRLDREQERYAAIHAYNRRAISVADPAVFAEMTVEAICEIFDVGFALLWGLDADGDPLPRPMGCADTAGQSGGAAGRAVDGDSERAAELVRNRAILDLVLDAGGHPSGLGDHAVLLEAGNHPLAELGFRQVVAARCTGPLGRALAVIIAGVREGAAGFHDDLAREQLGSFTLVGQQVGALLQNRADRATIQSQVQALRIEQERMAVAIEGANLGLWDWDLTQNEVYFSDRWKALLGYQPHELANHVSEWYARIHPDDLATSQELTAKAVAGETPNYDNTHRLRHRDGHYLWIHSMARVLRDESGRAYRMIGIHIDTTQQRLAREQAEAANRAKSEFLATMSHEIRTPLAGIQGMLALLGDSSLDADQAANVDLAIRSAQHLRELIDDILDLSKIEAGRMELESVVFAPGPRLAEAAQMLAERAQSKGLRLVVELDPGLPTQLVGDPRALRQVVTNLVGNAVKFTEHGFVRLKVAGERVDHERFELAVTVTDSGIGIDPAVQDRIFSPFTQADSTTTRVYGGTGLGLAICRRLVEQMGGRLWVTSTLGSGSSFDIRLPLPSPRGDVPRGTDAVGSAAGTADLPAGQRVLLVEDNPVNQRFARVLLERGGVTVVVADNGQQAVAEFMAGAFDAVLMDVQMPMMDGHEATARLRDFERANHLTPTPVIALTANAMAEDRRQSLAAGMDDFLPKPFTRAELFQALRRAWAPGS